MFKFSNFLQFRLQSNRGGRWVDVGAELDTLQTLKQFHADPYAQRIVYSVPNDATSYQYLMHRLDSCETYEKLQQQIDRTQDSQEMRETYGQLLDDPEFCFHLLHSTFHHLTYNADSDSAAPQQEKTHA